MSSFECGCQLVRGARRSEDREPLLEIADRQALAWSCPNAGHKGETEDPSALAVLDAVAELCDVERACLKTCPRWHATTADVSRAVSMRRYVEAGCPDTIESDPPVALIRAAHLVAAADGDRLRAEQREREEKAKSRG